MPIYEYECPKCQKVHEIVQKFSDPRMSECPDCGGAVSKLMSLSSFALKGSGWYTTDYKKSGKKSSEAPAPKKEGSEATPAKTAEPKKTESKPAASSTPASGASA